MAQAIGCAFRAMTKSPGLALALACVSSAQAQAPKSAELKFRKHAVIDEQQGGLVMATFMVPEQWKVTSKVRWNYADFSFPVRSMARIESPDGSAWVEFYPAEVFYWLEPAVGQKQAYGSRSLGMTYAPGVQIQQALQQFVLAPNRGKMANLQIVESRPIDARRFAAAFNFNSNESGQAMATRVRYTLNGRPVEENFYALLNEGNRVQGPPGPLGVVYERQRPLWLAHSLGATDGNLQAVLPLLTYIATSGRFDPIWAQQRNKVQAFLNAEFERIMAQGYARIAAAGELSRRISANNDAMLTQMQAKRAADNQREAARSAAAAGGNKSGFNDYIRGVERVSNPYGGESEVSPQNRYHWTDGSGNYRGSNDPGFNPNVSSGGGTSWQRMEPRQ
jgi:hypothetical protein